MKSISRKFAALFHLAKAALMRPFDIVSGYKLNANAIEVMIENADTTYNR